MISGSAITLEDTKDKHIYIGVWLHGMGWTPAGVVTFNDAFGYAGFSYFENYVANDYPPLNPATLNYRTTRNRHFVVDQKNTQMLDRTFWELLPTSGDFGHQALISRYPQYQGMNNAQKLHFLGQRMVGGLASHVRSIQEEVSVNTADWLDDVRREAVSFHLREAQRLHSNPNAFLAMTSYGGVRPKAMYQDESGRFWIAKFNLPTDPYDMAIAEHVAMRMAKDCGMKVPETEILRLPSGENVFLTERFDRAGAERRHSLSLFSLAPGIDSLKLAAGSGRGNTASSMAAIVRRFSDFQTDDMALLVIKLLVDIGFNNTDNHLRNTRLILNEQGLWELSPSFDILFNPRSQPHIYSPAGIDLSETCLSSDRMLEGMAQQTGVDLSVIGDLRDRVQSVTENWESYCVQAGMSADDRLKILSAISLGGNRAEIQHRIQQAHRQKVEQALRTSPKKT